MMSMMTNPATPEMGLMMTQTMIAMMIMVEIAVRAVVRTYQLRIGLRQMVDLICLCAKIHMIGYGSQPKFLKPGAGQIMSIFDERYALNGLKRLDSQAI